MSGLGLQTALGVFPERPLGPRVHSRLEKKKMFFVFFLICFLCFSPARNLVTDGWVSGWGGDQLQLLRKDMERVRPAEGRDS